MTNQCVHCTSSGDLDKCWATDCYRHLDWVVIALRERIAELEAEIKRLKNPRVHDVTDLYEEER